MFGPTVGEYLKRGWLGRWCRSANRRGRRTALRSDISSTVSVADPCGCCPRWRWSGSSASWLASGRSAKTVAHVHAVLHRALADAVRDGLVDRNVASLVSPLQAERPEMTTWTVTELKQFHRSGEGYRLFAAFVVSATTGMRRGEMLGLQRVDASRSFSESR